MLYFCRCKGMPRVNSTVLRHAGMMHEVCDSVGTMLLIQSMVTTSAALGVFNMTYT